MEPVADHLCRHPADDRIGRHVLGNRRARCNNRAVADIDPGHDVAIVAGPDIVAERGLREHVRGARQPLDLPVLVDPIEGVQMILEFVTDRKFKLSCTYTYYTLFFQKSSTTLCKT